MAGFMVSNGTPQSRQSRRASYDRFGAAAILSAERLLSCGADIRFQLRLSTTANPEATVDVEVSLTVNGHSSRNIQLFRLAATLFFHFNFQTFDFDFFQIVDKCQLETI